MWNYRNPVEIRFGAGAFATLGEAVAGRPYALVTYDLPPFPTLSRRLSELAGPPALVVDDIRANPDTADLAAACEAFGRATRAPEVIVALGGGSAIDSAKVLAAAQGDFGRVRAALAGTGPADLGAIPIVAVPTTAGTGSEVTCWSALWDHGAGRKYSLALPSLYPALAVVDPELMLSKPRDLTVATGLDALSHALESLWNVNANPLSANHAVAAACEILEVLPRLASDLADLALRGRMARAALFAGLAFSNTKTALAHSLSYPITLRHGVPHGIACSFSLPMVMESVIGRDDDCDAALGRIFGADLRAGVGRLRGFFAELGVSVAARDYGVVADDWRDWITQAFDGERGRNFIGTRAAFEAAADTAGGAAD